MLEGEKDNQNREKGITAGGKRKQQQSKVDVPADQNPLQLCGNALKRCLF